MLRFAQFVVTLAVLCLSACSSDVVIREPAPVPAIVKSDVKLKTEWSQSYSADKDQPTGVFRPAIIKNQVFIATNEGEVAAIDGKTGKELWLLDLHEPLSTGVAANAAGVMVVSRAGDVIFISKNGQEQWRQALDREVIQPPFIHENQAFVQASNSSIFALDLAAGEIQWQYSTRSPALTLRGTGQPIVYKDRLLVSLASGNLVALNIKNGALIWDRKLQVPKGSNEFERIIDLDGVMTLRDNIVFVPGYQGYLTAVEAYTGQILWQKDLSSYSQPVFSVDRLYVSDVKSHLLALDYRNGDIKWQSDVFEYRQLTAPKPQGLFLMAADMDGLVYLIDKITGDVVAKRKLGKAPFQLVAAGDSIIVQTANGKVRSLKLGK